MTYNCHICGHDAGKHADVDYGCLAVYGDGKLCSCVKLVYRSPKCKTCGHIDERHYGGQCEVGDGECTCEEFVI